MENKPNNQSAQEVDVEKSLADKWAREEAKFGGLAQAQENALAKGYFWGRQSKAVFSLEDRIKELENKKQSILESFKGKMEVQSVMHQWYSRKDAHMMQSKIDELKYIQSLTPTQSKAVGYSEEDMRKAINMARDGMFTANETVLGLEVNKEWEYTSNEIIQSFTLLQTKGREVEFTEWVRYKCDMGEENLWKYYTRGPEYELKSTSELFQLFLTTNPSNKGV